MGQGHLDEARARAVGTNLAADVLAAEVVTELARRGVETLVLRGPAIAAWLYRDGERDYGDVDLLVDPSTRAEAESALQSLGFEGRSLSAASAGPARHAEAWRRGAGPAVDIHRTIVGASAPDVDVWRALRAHASTVTLNDVAVPTLDRTGLLVVLTLHAAQHGLEGASRDLVVALRRVDLDDWHAATTLAAELDALPALEAGLRIDPSGAAVADRLGLHAGKSAETLLRAQAAPDLSLGLNWALDLPTNRARARFVAAKLFPSRDAMRSASRIAQRGAAGLALAYASRLGWLAARAPRAVRAVRQARRAARG